MNCKNCEQPVGEKYCGQCGTPVTVKRVDGHYIVHEIQHILHFEKGIFYTVRELLVRPGQNIRAFLTENRSRLVKPVIFIIVTSLLYTVIAHFFHIERNHASGSQAHSGTAAVTQWVEAHYGYANIIMGIFIGVWLKLFSWKSGYNFFEILIMLCFVMGTGMLIFTVFTLAEGVTGIGLVNVTSIVSLLYCIWAIGQFLGGKKWINYLVALLAYILGMATFKAMVMLTGYVIDIVTH